MKCGLPRVPTEHDPAATAVQTAGSPAQHSYVGPGPSSAWLALWQGSSRPLTSCNCANVSRSSLTNSKGLI